MSHNPLGKNKVAWYIINTTDYLTGWDEGVLAIDCTIVSAAMFLFDHVRTMFGCPKILISDQGMHFFNHMIEKLTKEFHIHHRKTTPYNPQ